MEPPFAVGPKEGAASKFCPLINGKCKTSECMFWGDGLVVMGKRIGTGCKMLGFLINNEDLLLMKLLENKK